MLHRARIAGMGQWVPPEVRTNDAWGPDFVKVSKRSNQRELIDIEHRVDCRADEITIGYMKAESGDPFLGAVERRVAPLDMTQPEVAALAAQAAIQDAGIDPRDIDLVLAWDAVPEFISPSSAPRIAHLVGATRAWGMTVDAACASTIHQLDIASAMIKSMQAKTVLLTQTHLLTRALRMNHPASPTIGDLATALVVTQHTDLSKGIQPMVSQSFGEEYNSVLWTRGKDQTPWYLAGGDFYVGSEDFVRARELIRSTVRLASESVLETLERSHCRPSEVDALISVQPRGWVPQAILEASGISGVAPTTFSKFSHLGSCGLVANLIEARNLGLLNQHSKTILYGQGAGFTKSAMLIVW
jgi:3-oxoacyl-[acyl-carrier-protein] synthase III